MRRRYVDAPLDSDEQRRASRGHSERPRRAPPTIELVGLAGVGKSHLTAGLLDLYGDRAVDLTSITPSLRTLPHLVPALVDAAPIMWLLMRRGFVGGQKRVRFAKAVLMQAWRERIVAHRGLRDCVVIVEEGWFHKLRQLRRLAGSGLSYRTLPGALRRRVARAHLVLYLTADDDTVCARKLRRRGIPVTPETLRRQYLESEALGQWREHLHTSFDLREAAAESQLRYEVIDYHDGFNLESDLLPLLARHGVA